MQNTTVIHCKLSYNGQHRRFLINSTEFASLYKQVQQLLALDNEFVLKYKDDEGDLITISSDAELSCALVCSPDVTILRLFAEPSLSKPKETEPFSPLAENSPSFECSRLYGGKSSHPGFGNKGCHQKKMWKFHMLTNKKQLIQTMLASYPNDRALSPEEADRKQTLQSKLVRIEGCLTKWSGYQNGAHGHAPDSHDQGPRGHGLYGHGPHNPQGQNGGQCSKKNWKKCEKMDKAKCRDRSDLSPEAKEEIMALKSKMHQVKPRIKALKCDIWAKKQALSLVKDRADAEKLNKQIVATKEEIFALKEDMCGLKRRIRELMQCSFTQY